jgi:two-component system response regulator HydG
MRNNILIIDDDIDLCTVLARFLTKNGYETDVAHTGYKGICPFYEKNLML